MATKNSTPWVVAGGKIGELGHCTRCGEGLNIGLPQPLPIVTAAMNAFVGIHKSCKEGMRVEPKITPRDWIGSRDTGISSCTIWAVLANQPSPMRDYDVPHDPSDFGRCYRLLKLFPEWIPRLGEVAERFPIWKPFVREWANLTVMYEQALSDKSNRSPAMYDLMQQLRREDQL